MLSTKQETKAIPSRESDWVLGYFIYNPVKETFAVLQGSSITWVLNPERATVFLTEETARVNLEKLNIKERMPVIVIASQYHKKTSDNYWNAFLIGEEVGQMLTKSPDWSQLSEDLNNHIKELNGYLVKNSYSQSLATLVKIQVTVTLLLAKLYNVESGKTSL